MSTLSFLPPPKEPPLKTPPGPTPCNTRLGMSGDRSRSCRSLFRVASTSARWEASSGRVVKPMGTNSSTVVAGEIKVTWR